MTAHVTAGTRTFVKATLRNFKFLKVAFTNYEGVKPESGGALPPG